MKQGFSKFVTMFLFLMFFLFGSNNIAASDSMQYTNKLQNDRMLIVIAAPSVEDEYYKKSFQGILDFDIRYAKAIMGHDNVVVLTDKKTIQYLNGKLPDDIILEAEVLDIWMRDFSPVHPNKMVQFVYDRPNEKSIQDSFKYFAKENGLKFTQSRLKVDGGNVVDNGEGKIILTEKIFDRNSHLTEKQIAKELKKLLGATDIAFIPMDEEYLGHSDGMVMFVGKNKLLVNHDPEEPALKKEVISYLKTGLPNIEIVEIEGAGYGEKYGAYASACGIYVNAVVTNNYIYAPTFGTPKDKKAIKTIKENTDKNVITVNAEDVCCLGGSVRCLSWQLTGDNARKLIESARTY
jgi:agmatine/peptidylarginine deiminase